MKYSYPFVIRKMMASEEIFLNSSKKTKFWAYILSKPDGPPDSLTDEVSMY